MKQPQNDHVKDSSPFWRWFKRLFALFFLLGLAGIAAIWLLVLHYSYQLPDLKSLAEYQPSLISRVYARDYQILGEFYIQRRQYVPLSHLPKHVIQAFIAIEDRRFYQHPGVDLKGILRAALVNFQAGRITQGASTIHQQVAKGILLSSERTLKRKVKELILAWRMDEHFTKDQILELYLNQIYLGAGAYGVASAARVYYDKDVTELTIAQAAMLAALPKAPSDYDPWRHPKQAAERQELVLQTMTSEKFITPEQAREARNEPLKLARPGRHLEEIGPYYLEHVRQMILKGWDSQTLYNDGLEIYSSLDPDLQSYARDAVLRGLREYDQRHGFRGVLAKDVPIDEEGKNNWRISLKDAMKTPSGLHKGLVISLAGKGKEEKARILLADNREVELALPAVSWARKKIPDKPLGPSITKISDVLALGDVILLSDDEPLTPDGKPNWRLSQEPDAEAALVAMDPNTGQVLALVGGYDFDRSKFNRATQARRQPGSSFKPLLYAVAMENGATPSDIIDDSPLPIYYRDSSTGPLKLWNPKNYENEYYGPTTLRVALEHSRNLVTIRLLRNLTIPVLMPYLQKFGLNIPPERQNLSLALGSIDFTPLEMTTAYAAFANGGKMLEPVFVTRVQDRTGRTLDRHGGGDCLLCHRPPSQGALPQDPIPTNAPGEEEGVPDKGKPQTQTNPYLGVQAISPESAYQVTSLLKGVIQRGTGQRAKRLPWPLAGKTGTTNELRDAWFIGYSPSLVLGVWVGRDDFTPLGGTETGAKAALPIWIRFMEKALAGTPRTDFPMPSGIRLVPVDADTGQPPGPDTKLTILEAFKKDQMTPTNHVQVPTTPTDRRTDGIY